MGLDRNDESAGPRRRRGRAVVRLDTVALWDRLALLGRSQNWLAGKAGISPGYLSMLVNEGRAPSGRIRRRIQEALGIEDFHQLFKLEDRDEPITFPIAPPASRTTSTDRPAQGSAPRQVQEGHAPNSNWRR